MRCLAWQDHWRQSMWPGRSQKEPHSNSSFATQASASEMQEALGPLGVQPVQWVLWVPGVRWKPSWRLLEKGKGKARGLQLARSPSAVWGVPASSEAPEAGEMETEPAEQALPPQPAPRSLQCQQT